MLKLTSWSGVSVLGLTLFFSATQPGNAAERQALHGHVPPAVAKYHLQPFGELPATRMLQLAIELPLRNEAALDDLLRQIYDPASPEFHHYLTPEQFAAQFGPTEQDYQAVIAFVEAKGLKVTGRHLNRVVLDVSGPVADIQRTFHAKLHTYRHPVEPRDFYAPDVEPTIDLAVPILQVSGLNNYSLPHPSLRAEAAVPTSQAAPNSGSGPFGSYMGRDFRAAYAPGVTLNGSGQSIALVQFDGYYSNDIAAYLNRAGLTNYPVSLTNVPVNGGVPTPGSGNSEVCLDIEMVISMAPAVSKIIVYEGPNGSTPWSTILSRIANDNLARQISCSWGGGGPNAVSEGVFKQMAAQGQSFFNASGDSDAFTGSILFPSDSTNITEVGGTTLTTSGPNGSYVSETVWNWGYVPSRGDYEGSSGGISPTYAIPDWQQGISMTSNQGSTTMRNVPDVALTADNVYVTYGNGSSGTFGGTSCAAPLWAGFTALINQQAAIAGRPSVGFINPAIYAIGKSANYTADFHDTTAGDNTWTGSPTKYYAVAGYDLCTGWGTPNGQNLINDLAGLPEPLAITPASGFAASGAAGGPFSVTNQIFLLTNSSAAPLNWAVANPAPWLDVSPGSGTLAAGSKTNVTVSLNGAAYSLTVGMYLAGVSFTNQTTGVAQVRQFALQVIPPLAVSQTSGFIAAGPVGGPFSRTTQDFALTNLGAGSVNWNASSSAPWLTAVPGSGTLPAGGQATLTVSLNSGANSFSAGIYNANMVLTDQDGGTTTLPFTLFIGQPLVQNGGFETGDFTGWTQSGNTAYTSVASGSRYAHSGTYGAALGPSGTLGYLTQFLPTTPGQGYVLSLWLDSPNVTGSYTPNEFSVSWNGITLFDRVNIGEIGWTNLQFLVTATNYSTALQFGFRDDPTYLSLDDVSVTLFTGPMVQTVPATGTNFSLAWGATTGMTYQVQYRTNLLSGTWSNLGKTLPATNANLTATDTNALRAAPQRYYRLKITR